MSSKRSYAFVLPRFGEEIIGGAETLAGQLAKQLSIRGDYVEVFTTCARDNRTWENAYPVGKDRAFGIPVSRFLVDDRNFDIWVPKQISISEGMRLSVEDQLEWMSHGVNSSGLYAEIINRKDDFDAFFFAPYLFSTTFWGSHMLEDKAFLIPCLHDETYAYQEVIANMFHKVRGALFNANAEKKLAHKLYGNIVGGEVGMGFEVFLKTEVQAIPPFLKRSFHICSMSAGKKLAKMFSYWWIIFVVLKIAREFLSKLNW